MNIPSLPAKPSEKLYILINLFIKPGVSNNWTDIDWSRERGAFKILMNKYKDFDFFYSIPHLNNKFNSLLGLLSTKYQDISKMYNEFIIEKPKKKTFTLDSESVIMIADTERKPKNLREFINN